MTKPPFGGFLGRSDRAQRQVLDKLAVDAANLAILNNTRTEIVRHEFVPPQMNDQVIVGEVDQ